MVARLFTVEFDKPNATYQPGETITGCVTIDLEEEKSCREFRIAFKGFAHVHWTESRSETDSHGNSRSTTDHYTATERYFDFQYPLIHKPPGNEELIIPAGRSEYRFAYQLPTNIPCSFEHHIGYIRYTVKGVVDIPWRFDWWAKAAFTVITPFDLNSVEYQCLPIDDESVKNYSCCCCSKGSINARVKMPSTGYVPGQTIDVDINFDVKSSKIHVPKVSAVLEEKITFYAQGSTNIAKISLQNAQYEGPFEKSEHVLLKLRVPPVPPSNLLPCRIINLEYRVLANVHVNGVHRRFQKTYPILIGTIPLHSWIRPQWPNDTDVRPSAPTDLNGDKVPPYPGTLSGMIQPGEGSTHPIGWMMPPPSYEECMQQTKNIRDADDANDGFGADKYFAPRYPVFNFNLPNK